MSLALTALRRIGDRRPCRDGWIASGRSRHRHDLGRFADTIRQFSCAEHADPALSFRCRDDFREVQTPVRPELPIERDIWTSSTAPGSRRPSSSCSDVPDGRNVMRPLSCSSNRRPSGSARISRIGASPVAASVAVKHSGASPLPQVSSGRRMSRFPVNPLACSMRTLACCPTVSGADRGLSAPVPGSTADSSRTCRPEVRDGRGMEHSYGDDAPAQVALSTELRAPSTNSTNR
jgi:hypothetical protein